jgi:RNA polymerase sigma factor for flagellar operon FliA
VGSAPISNVDKLVESYRGYAEAITVEVLRKLPPTVDRADLHAAADLGLVEAARSFDPSRGILFKTFAYYRIRGAIYDCLRKMGWFSKTEYKQLRFEAAANEYLTDYSSAPPADGTAEQDYEELKNLTGSIVSCYLVSLDSVPETQPADTAASPEDLFQGMEERSQVRQALAELPEKNRHVLVEMYFRERTMEEIGRNMGLSKSWVCRLHARSLEMLRDKLRAGSPAGKQATKANPAR